MENNWWIILAVTILCIHWSGQDEVNDVPVTESALSATTALPAVRAENYLANMVNNFGYKLLLQMMDEKKEDNIVISPASISGLLAMTMLGSVGTTYNEIAETVGFSQDILQNRRNHEQFGELLQVLNLNVSSKTLYADALFVDVNAPIRELYRHYLQEVYRGDLLTTDFKQSEATKDFVNEWVYNHTEGKIEQFLEKALPTSTKVLLLSALYFSGQWEQPFTPEYTAKMPFKTPKEDVLADLMLNFGQFRYLFSTKHDLQMIALPYNDSVTTMYALKPRNPRRISLSDIMNKLDYQTIDELINQMSTKKCVVRFPKMELKSASNIENTLKSMGIRNMFIPGEANFALMVDSNTIANKTEEEIITRINSGDLDAKGVTDMLQSLPNPGIYVDSIIHDIKMTINEYGTEAVAATSALLARSAEMFYANSPFFMFIRNEKTKLVTFSAVIVDPTV